MLLPCCLLRSSRILTRLACAKSSPASTTYFKDILARCPSRSYIRSLALCDTPKHYYKIDTNVTSKKAEHKPPPEPEPPEEKQPKIVYVAGIVLACGVGSFLYYVMFPPSREEFIKQQREEEEPVKIKIPADSSAIPKEVPYLLIGGEPASFAAFRSIKTEEPRAKVMMITEEPYLPYMKNPLRNNMWYQTDDLVQNLEYRVWGTETKRIFTEPEEFFIDCALLENEPKGGFAILRGWSVKKIDAEKKVAVLDDDTEIHFNKCLLATGSRPKNLSVFKNAPQEIKDKITVFHNLDDFKRLYALTKTIKSLAIIGCNKDGSELACSINRNGQSGIKVTQLFSESGNVGDILPEYLSKWTSDRIREQGVEIIPNVNVQSVSLTSNGDQVELTLNNGEKVIVDHVVVSLGTEPNNDLAIASNLAVEPELGGILVNSELSTRSDIYAAGECTCYNDNVVGKMVSDYHDHSIQSGRVAGENMVGLCKTYNLKPFTWSELGSKVNLEAVGITDSSLPTVGVFKKESPNAATNEEQKENTNKANNESVSKIITSEPKTDDNYDTGVVFYLKDDIVVGVLMYNVFGRLGIARQVLNEKKKFDDLNEVAKLFNIHDDYEDDDLEEESEDADKKVAIQ